MTEYRIIYRVEVHDEKLLLKRAKGAVDTMDALLVCMESNKPPLECGFEILNQDVYRCSAVSVAPSEKSSTEFEPTTVPTGRKSSSRVKRSSSKPST